jgi:sugar phosphate permease
VEAGGRAGRRQVGPGTLLAATCLAIIAVYLTSLAVPPLIPIFVDDVGLSYSEAGGLMSAFTLTYAVGSLVSGSLADRMDVLHLMAAGVALCGLAGLAFSATTDVVALLLLRAVAGVGLAFVFTPGIRFAASLFPDRANLGVGWVLAAVNIGVALTFLTTPLLESATSWPWVFRVYGVVAFAVAALLLMPRAPQARLMLETDHRPSETAALLRNPRLLGTTACLFMTMFMIYAVITWFPAFLSDVGDFGAGSVALASTLLPVASIPASILGGALVDRGARPTAVALGGLALAIAVVGLAIAAPTAYIVLIVVAVLAVVGPGAGLVALYALPPLVAGVRAAGRVTGIGNFGAYVGAIVATYAGGWIVDAGGYDVAFVCFAVVAAIGAFVVVPTAARAFADQIVATEDRARQPEPTANRSLDA